MEKLGGKVSHLKYIKMPGDRELKRKARDFINGRIKSGRIIRSKVCSACGCHGIIDFHHPDYNKLNEGVWLCHSCHIRLHFGHKIKGKLTVYDL